MGSLATVVETMGKEGVATEVAGDQNKAAKAAGVAEAAKAGKVAGEIRVEAAMEVEGTGVEMVEEERVVVRAEAVMEAAMEGVEMVVVRVGGVTEAAMV